MDIEEENMTEQEMMEKIAQLEHSASILKDQNTEMRSFLDAADEDISRLQSENTFLKKQVKDLEERVSSAQSVEPEPTNCQPDYHDLRIKNEMKIMKLERECASLKEENKNLTDEVCQVTKRNLQQLHEQDDVHVNQMKDSLQALESEVAQFKLKQRDEIIQQKDQELKHAVEIMEEYSTIIKDLRLEKRQLKEELVAVQDEVSFAIAIDHLDAKDKSSSPALSFAEELRLLDSSAHTSISTSDVTQANGEVMSEKVPNITFSTTDKCKQTIVESSEYSKCGDILMTVIQKVLLFLGIMFLFFASAFITSGSVTVNSRPCS